MSQHKKRTNKLKWKSSIYKPAMLVFFINSTGCASAANNATKKEICSSVATRYSVVRMADEIKILSFVTNYSNKAIEYVPDEFSSSLSITAERVGKGDKIKVVIPMAGLPMAVILQKHETHEGELLLNMVIPDLQNILKENAVKVSWDGSFSPDNACFFSDYKHTVILELIVQ